MSLLKFFFIFLVKIYQKCLSPFLGKNCRFHPTCSKYALDCLENLSLPKAVLRIGVRLMKCHPFHSGGYDPIRLPPKKFHNPDVCEHSRHLMKR